MLNLTFHLLTFNLLLSLFNKLVVIPSNILSLYIPLKIARGGGIDLDPVQSAKTLQTVNVGF